MSAARWCGGFALVLAAVVAAGCDSSGPQKFRVTGTVKYKGEPIKLGTINFRSLDGTQSSAGAIVNGKYELTEKSGLAPGNYVVAINYPDPNAPQIPEDSAPGDPATEAPRDLLPPKYNIKSELTAEVKEESNEINYDLK